MHFLATVLFVVLYLGSLLAISRHYWRRYKLTHPDGRLRYRITDLWAFSVGISPAMMLTAWGIREIREGRAINGEGWLIVAGLLLPALLMGMFIGALDFEGQSVEETASYGRAAFAIIGGAVFGVGLAIPCLLGVGLLVGLTHPIGTFAFFFAAALWLYVKISKP